MKRLLLVVPAMFVLSFSIAAPANAQWGRSDPRPSYGYGPYSEVRRIAFDRGYREGVKEGEKDGRSRDPFRYQDEGDYRDGDVGYTRSYGDREFYRQAFRSGFADGYADGYRRYAGGGYGNYRYGDPRYGGGYGHPGRDDRYLSPFEIGARDGFEKGREDARERRAFDARRHKWYREGDRDYDDRYGNRERYKNEYRRGFLAGYDRGFRNLR
jgi:hypothetical protein